MREQRSRLKVDLIMVTIVMLAVSILMAEPLNVDAAQMTGSCGENAVWIYDSGVVTVAGSGTVTDNWTNETFDVNNVTKLIFEEGIESIDCTFSSYKKLKEVTISDTVSELKFGMFSDCVELESVKLPAGIDNIPTHLFQNCSSLKECTIPEGVTKIGIYAFDRCVSLESVTIPEGVTEIDGIAFYNCTSLQSVDLPSSLKVIGNDAFKGVDKPSEIVIPENIEEIGDSAFYGLKSIKKLKFSSSLKTIGKHAFQSCVKLTSVVFEDCEADIQEMAFYECEKLASIEFGNKIKSIGNDAFVACKSLKTVNLPTNISSVGDGWFWACTSLESVVIPDGVTSIGQGTFSGCNNIKTIELPDTLTSIGDYCFQGVAGNNGGLKTLVFPSSLKTIGDKAFNEVYVERVELPSSLVNIGDDNFITGSDKPAVIICTNTTQKNYFDENGYTYLDATDKIDIAGATVDNCELEYEYSGAEIEPQITVKYPANNRTMTLEKDIDYEINYSNNKELGVATITVTGKGYFTGSVEKKFSIYSYIEKCELEWDSTPVLYDGNKHTPEVKISLDQKELIENTDYELTYGDNIENEGIITIEGKGFIKGEKVLNFDIYKLEFAELGLVVTSPTSYLYEGTAIEPDVEISYRGKEDSGKVIKLVKGKDYVLSYSDNVNEGTATIQVDGIGQYKGSTSVKFNIYKNNLESDKTVFELEYDKILYDGKEKKPTYSITYEGDAIQLDKDYSVTYSNNIEEGMATVTITGKGSYKGTISKQFEIYRVNLEDSKTELSLEYEKTLYDGTDKKPIITVKYDNNELITEKDYEITYHNNVDMGMAVATITGKGSYKGKIDREYEIYKYNLQDAKLEADKTSFIYDGAVHTPVISVRYNDNTLIADTDYKLTIGSEKESGQYKAVIEGVGQYTGKRELEYIIEPIVIDDADVILKDNIFTYDGSAKKPTVTVTHAGNTLISDQDYQLAYKNNIDEGTAYVVVDGINNYSGHIEVSFKILPYQSGMDAVYKEEDTLIDDNYVYHIIDVDDKEVEFAAPANKKETNVVIPSTITTANGDVFKVTSIGEKAFYKNTKIKKLTVANTVTSIENYAFYGCKNLTTIKIGNGIEIIGDSAFRKCTKLTSITLPKSVDKLGKNSFYGCKKLKKITIKANQVVDVQSNAIKGVSEKCVIKVPKKLVKKYKKEFDKKSGFKKGMKIKKY